MAKMVLAMMCCGVMAYGWLPLAVLPNRDGGEAALGTLIRADGDAMPQVATEVTLQRTADELVFHIVCHEPDMGKISMTREQSDSDVWNDDCVEIFIQPKGWEKYAHFIVNAAGTVCDELGMDRDWNCRKSVKGNRLDDQWTMTVALPFAELGGIPQNGDKWRLNVCRNRTVMAELSSWSYTGLYFHQPDRFGELVFDDVPSVSSVKWKMEADGAARLDMPCAEKLEHRVNGDVLPEDGVVRFDAKKPCSLELESLWKGRALHRSLYLVSVNPLTAYLSEAESLVKDGQDDESKALLKEIRRLMALAESLSPEDRTLLLEPAKALMCRARNHRIIMDFRRATGFEKSIAYGVESSLVKHQAHSLFKGEVGGPIRLDAARNEMDAAQLMLFAADSVLLQTEAHVNGDLQGDGASMPASCLRLRRVGFIQTCKPVYTQSYTGLCPDPLMPLAPFDIAPHSFETIWVDVRVPMGTPAGLYKTTLTVTAMNREPTTVPVEVRVRNFTIPKRSSITTAFGMNPSWRVWQDPKAYLANLLEHRITPYTCVPMPKLVKPCMMNWKTAKNLTVTVKSADAAELLVMLDVENVGSIRLPKQPIAAGEERTIVYETDSLPQNGILRATFIVQNSGAAELEAALTLANGEKRALLPRSRRGTEIRNGWLQGWPTWLLDAWQQPDTPTVMDWTEFDTAFAEALEAGITSHIAGMGMPIPMWSAEYQRHLAEKGWLQYFYTYLSDEPEPKDYPDINATLSEVKRPAPGALKNMMTARSFPPELPFVDIWCPELYSYNPELSRKEQEKGREVWWYVAFSTRHPYPNIWIDYPLLDCRVWPWMSWKHDVDGMLYWSVTYWLRNPWETGEMFPNANGDGSMLYPGNDGQPVDSMRWECLRDGMEDYEVLCLLEAAKRELGQREPELTAEIDRLCAVPSNVLVSYCDYNPLHGNLLATRQAMSDCLEKAVNALGHEPVIEGRPRRRPGVSQDEVQAALAQMEVTQANSEHIEIKELPQIAPMEGLKLNYRFDTTLPFIFDYSGNEAIGFPKGGCARAEVEGKKGLQMKEGYVQLPAGKELLGERPAEGTVEFTVKPDFAPADMATENENKFACMFYLMETDGNGLPDGMDEIGVFVMNGSLCVRMGGDRMLNGSALNTMEKGKWHRVRLAWKPGSVTLWLNGKPVIALNGDYDAPKLDYFPGTLGAHAASRNFCFSGEFGELKIWDRWMPEE